MAWAIILERLHVKGKLSAARLDRAKGKGLVKAAEAKAIKDKKKAKNAKVSQE